MALARERQNNDQATPLVQSSLREGDIHGDIEFNLSVPQCRKPFDSNRKKGGKLEEEEGEFPFKEREKKERDE